MKITSNYILLALSLLSGLVVVSCAKVNPKFQDSLTNALNAQNAAFQACYEKALDKNRDAKGEMDLVLGFSPNSKKVEKASIERSDIKDDAMKTCVAEAAKQIETEELPGASVDGKYTIDFKFNE